MVGVLGEVAELVVAGGGDQLIELTAPEAREARGELSLRAQHAARHQQRQHDDEDQARDAQPQAHAPGDYVRSRCAVERSGQLAAVERGGLLEELERMGLLGLHGCDRVHQGLARLARHESP